MIAIWLAADTVGLVALVAVVNQRARIEWAARAMLDKRLLAVEATQVESLRVLNGIAEVVKRLATTAEIEETVERVVGRRVKPYGGSRKGGMKFTGPATVTGQMVAGDLLTEGGNSVDR